MNVQLRGQNDATHQINYGHDNNTLTKAYAYGASEIEVVLTGKPESANSFGTRSTSISRNNLFAWCEKGKWGTSV